MWVRRMQVQMGRDGAILQGQGQLHQPGNPGGHFEMADIGLDGADIERCASLFKNRTQGPHLNRIPQWRARAMRFDVTDLGWLQVGIGERTADHLRLRGPIGNRQPTTRPILIKRCPADDGDNRILGGQGVGEALEHNDATALTAHIAIRCCVKGFALSIGGQHIAIGEHGGERFVQQQVDATGQGGVTFASTQALTGQVDGGQGRRTGRIDGNTRASNPQQIGDAPRRGALHIAGGGVKIVLLIATKF